MSFGQLKCNLANLRTPLPDVLLSGFDLEADAAAYEVAKPEPTEDEMRWQDDGGRV